MTKEMEKEIQDLVIARLQTLSEGKEISIGSDGEFSKDQLIEAIKRQDELGRKIIAIEMNFLRALKMGVLYDESNFAIHKA